MIGTEKSSHIQRFRNWWGQFTNPIFSLCDKETQNQSRLLTSILYVFIIVNIFLGVIRMSISSFNLDLELVARFLVAVIGLFLIRLSRRGKIFLSSALAVTLGSIILLALVIDSGKSGGISPLNYMVVMLLFGSLFLPITLNFTIFFFQLIGMLSLPFITSNVLISDIILGPFSLHLTIGLIVIAVAHHRNILENSRKMDLARNEKRFREVFESSPIGLELFDSSGKLTQVNPSTLEIFGIVDENEILGFDLFSDPNLPTTVENDLKQGNTVRYTTVFEFDKVKENNLYHTNLSGPIYIDVMITSLFENEKISGYLVQVSDITDIKTAEKKLLEKTTQLEGFFTIALDLLCITDLNGNFILLNKQWEEVLGFSIQELTGRRFYDFIHPDDLKSTQEAVARLADDKPVFNFVNRYRGKDGSYRILEWRSQPFGDLVYAAARDITDRVETEMAVFSQKELLETLMETIPSPLFYKDKQGQYMGCNKAFEEYYGITRDQLVDKTLFNIMPRSYAERLWRNEKILLERGGKEVFEGKVYVTEGMERDVVIYKATFKNSQNEIAGMIGVILDISERKKIEQAERDQRILAEALRDTAAALNTSLVIEDVLKNIFESLHKVVPHEAANIMLTDEQKTETITRVIRTRNYDEKKLESDSVIGVNVNDVPGFKQMAETGKPLIIANTHETSSWVDYPESSWVRSYLGVPIQIKGKTIGFLNLDSRTPGFFKEKHAENLTSFVYQAAVAIENARLYERVQRMAIVDELTNLYNRRGLLVFGKREMARAYRYASPLGILFVDIDHFRQFNNKYSYAIGDQVLRFLAEKMRACVRESDLIGRYGGEEFVIILTDIDQTALLVIAERLRKTVEDSYVLTEFGDLSITVSIGAAHYQPTGTGETKEMFSLEELIEQGGQALHKAKAAGRNRVDI